MSDYCVPIDGTLWNRVDERSSLVDLVGGKAMGLSSLCAAGLSVPRAFVVSALVYRGVLAGDLSDITSFKDMRRRIESVDLPATLTTELLQSASELRTPLAARSSAVMEDSVAASWAGQFKSILGIQVQALPRSILRCWSSLFCESVQYYATGIRFDLAKAAMAVVVQEMVSPALWSGVAFTGTNASMKQDRTMIVIEAVRGLGELLVSGSSSAEIRIEARIANGDIVTRFVELDPRRGLYVNPSRMLPDLAVAELVRGAKLLEGIHEGRRLDIEWAWDGHELWFLQVRPIAFD